MIWGEDLYSPFKSKLSPSKVLERGKIWLEEDVQRITYYGKIWLEEDVQRITYYAWD